MTRPLEDLLRTTEPAWPWVTALLGGSAVQVELLAPSREAADRALTAAQITVGSPMGAIIHNSAGILLDHGWLRILGSGRHARFRRGFDTWNSPESRGFVMVADDVLGGQFALNGGAFGDNLGKTYYFSPDQLNWEGLDLTYSDFLEWSASAGALSGFYQDYRWDGWATECERLTGDESISMYPPLFAKAALADRSRAVVPASELLTLHFDFARQLCNSDKAD